MKRNIKKMLSEELDRLAPPMSEEVRSHPLPQGGPEQKTRRPAFRRWVALAAAAVLVLIVAAPALYFGTVRHPSVVLLEINPAVALSTDLSDVVTAVVSRNGDGDLMLADQDFVDSLIGKSSAEAAVLLADRAMTLGYFEETDNAVRVSVANEVGFRANNLRRDLSRSLTDYFCRKGVMTAVLSRQVSAADLSGAGLAGQSVDQIAQALSDSPVRVQEAQDQLVTEDNLNQSYVERFRSYALEVVQSIGQTTKDKKADLAELQELSDRILAHEENPGKLFGLIPQDYWELSESEEPLGEGISALMAEMTDRLADFEADYEQEIDSEASLFFLDQFYQTLDPDQLAQLFTDLINSIADLAFGLQLDLLLSFLNGDGSLTDWISGLFEGLAEPPQTVEDYADQSRQMLKQEAGMRAEAAEAFNRQERQPISEEDYRAYLDSLGDLDDYWDSLAH